MKAKKYSPRRQSRKPKRSRKSRGRKSRKSRSRGRKSRKSRSRGRKSRKSRSRGRKSRKSRPRKRSGRVKRGKSRKSRSHRPRRQRRSRKFSYSVAKYKIDTPENNIGRIAKIDNMDSCRKNMCNSYGILPKETLTELHRYIPLEEGYTNEVAGPLYLEKLNGDNVYAIKVNPEHVNMGDEKEVDKISSHYNFHSHPQAAYINHQCDIGWPSRDDYVTFLDGFFKDNTLFHLVVTVEGIYVLKINPCIQDELIKYYNGLKNNSRKDQFIHDVDNWADDNINISKERVKIASGVPTHLLPRRLRHYKVPEHSSGGLIRTPKQYIDFIRSVECDKINKFTLDVPKPLFDVEFISWEDAKHGKKFTFSKLKQGNTCSVKLK